MAKYKYDKIDDVLNRLLRSLADDRAIYFIDDSINTRIIVIKGHYPNKLSHFWAIRIPKLRECFLCKYFLFIVGSLSHAWSFHYLFHPFLSNLAHLCKFQLIILDIDANIFRRVLALLANPVWSFRVAYFMDQQLIVSALVANSLKATLALMFTQENAKTFITIFALLYRSSFDWKLIFGEYYCLHSN